MTGIVDWAASRARMVLAFILLSIMAGALAYASLPKEGEPDIEIPAIFVSVPFPGISAEDSEKLLVKPMETELSDLDGLKSMQGTAAENYAGIALEFEFGWDKTKILADIRDKMNTAEASFPSGAEKYSISELNFSEFPIIIVNLTGAVPERTLLRVAKDLQDRLESLEPVLEAALTGHRDEMVEVVIDPLRLEAYNVTAGELINVVVSNNQLIAAGEVETDSGAFAVKIPSSFDEQQDIFALPVKTEGDRVITLGDIADIRLTFEDRAGTARFNAENTVALQVVKRKGFNIIDTAAEIRAQVEAERATWPPELQKAISVGTSNDQSFTVEGMVSQLEGSVLTAIALVMIVVLATLGPRSALLVGFAIPTSFLLCFALLAVMGISISNIVMFGLILAVGMLVDGAIVVVEYADKRIQEGTGPMQAYVEAAKRMFWPVVSSTATTLCAFLPMLFWPGVPGQFMGMLPVTLIFVLSASLVVALIYLPVVGGVAGRMSRTFERASDALARSTPWWLRALLVPPALYLMYICALQVLNPTLLGPEASRLGSIVGGILFVLSAFLASIALGATKIDRDETEVTNKSQSVLAAAFEKLFPFWLRLIFFVPASLVMFGFAVALLVGQISFSGDMSYVAAALAGIVALFAAAFVWISLGSLNDTRTPFGNFIWIISGNPFMPVVTIVSVIAFVIMVGSYFGENNNGVEFFVDTEPEQAIVYVRARGNLSVVEKDALVKQVEQVISDAPGIDSAFAFAGAGGLNSNTGGAAGPNDSIGQVQIEMIRWSDRLDFAKANDIALEQLDGNWVIDDLRAKLNQIPGIKVEIQSLGQGPASAKPVHLRLKTNNWEDLLAATATARARFDDLPGLIDQEDNLPLPGIDWQIDVDVEKAGRYGADVATVGGMVQLVTRGVLLDTMRVDSSDEEIEIRVRLPKEDRLLSTLDTLKVRTQDGLVPLSNFISRKPVAQLAQINRIDQKRFFDVKAGVTPNLIKFQNDSLVPIAIAREIETDGEVSYQTVSLLQSDVSEDQFREMLETDQLSSVSVNPNERIEALTQWIESESPFPPSVEWEWTGDAEDQAESAAFLQVGFSAALGLMFIILLAQFNSVYNALLVLLAVVLSTTGVLIGMLVMEQPFSIIMTGTGIVALAGIVVNNNIVLIDTYQEYSQYMPRLEAIVRTAEARIRPVLLTTVTTMAGLAPMMFGLSLDFFGGGYTIDSPTALWWKQLATAVVFGLGIATVLTLVFTPSMLALRVWLWTILAALMNIISAITRGSRSAKGRDYALRRAARRVKATNIIWDVDNDPSALPKAAPDLRAAE